MDDSDRADARSAERGDANVRTTKVSMERRPSLEYGLPHPPHDGLRTEADASPLAIDDARWPTVSINKEGTT